MGCTVVTGTRVNWDVGLSDVLWWRDVGCTVVVGNGVYSDGE